MENNSQEETKLGIKTGEMGDEELAQVNGGIEKPEQNQSLPMELNQSLPEELKKKKYSVPKFRAG